MRKHLELFLKQCNLHPIYVKYDIQEFYKLKLKIFFSKFDLNFQFYVQLINYYTYKQQQVLGRLRSTYPFFSVNQPIPFLVLMHFMCTKNDTCVLKTISRTKTGVALLTKKSGGIGLNRPDTYQQLVLYVQLLYRPATMEFKLFVLAFLLEKCS